MAVVGSLSDFSIPEVLQFLQTGKKTGLLAVQANAPTTAAAEFHFIWLGQGRVVSATSRLDGRCLTGLLQQRHHLSALMAARLIRRCPPDVPLGLFLQGKGLLQPQQLKQLFVLQVMQHVRSLFEIADGRFRFDGKAPLPAVEMTGLSIPATEVTLPGLRALKNWQALQEKLPAPSSSLNRVTDRPSVKLSAAEQQVWSLADGTAALSQIAAQLDTAIATVQQIAFRLVLAGLVEEVPLAAAQPIAAQPAQTSGTDPVSQNFLKNLMGYLRQLPQTS